MSKLTPEQRIALAYATEQRYGLPKGMLVAQLNAESSNGKNLKSPQGATGAMQFMPATAQSMGIDPNDDTQAIDGAGRLMAKNLGQAKGNVGKALELYYAGSPAGIGPKSKAYPGQVASNWNDDDAFDAASNFNAPAPTATPGGSGDDDADFEKSASLTPDTAPAPTAPASSDAAEPDQFADLKAGIQKISDTTHSPYQVKRYVRESGYDPGTIQNLDAAVNTGGKLHFGHFSPTPIEHNSINDLVAGIERGASDVTGSLRGFASYMDNKVPLLGSIDRAAGTVAPALDPSNLSADYNSSILARKAYDQNYGSLASGTGRIGAQIALTAPLISPAFRAAGAAPGVGSFLAGTAGKASVDAAGTAIPGNLLLRGASLSTAGTGYGAANNALTSASSDQPFAQYVGEGAKAGAVLGPVIGAVGAGANAVINRAAPGVDAATAKLAQLAQDKYGFNLTGDQITNSPLVRKVSAMMNLNPVNNNLARDAEQQAQFSRAVGQTFGANAPDGVLSPEVMQAAKTKIGGTMNEIAARSPVHIDDALLSDLADIDHTFSSSVTDQEMAPIRRNIDNVLNAAKDGDTISGETYQRLTAKGSPLDVASSSANPSIRQAAIQIRGALDDALERSANPEDVKALRAARLAYKNMKTVEPLVSKDTDNMVSPRLLNNRVSVVFKNRAYQGAGDLDELGQIGKRFLTPPSTSGTPEGIRANRMLEGAGAAGGLAAAVGAHLLGYGDLASGLTGVGLFAGRRAAAGGTNAIIKRVIQSPAYKNRLLQRALDGSFPTPVNGLPPLLTLTGNRIFQQMAFPPPQPPPVQPQQ